ncbi:PepSY domain-containing protein [Virgibacillus xinjiangensis]|uniref:PepSY domain-containing protein n=1 Tax=Virgibacillus xinjiangensis TaxID=393090 RepID=A0ABV7CU95_9BACI
MKKKLFIGTIAAGVIFSGITVAASEDDGKQEPIQKAETSEKQTEISYVEAKKIALDEKDGHVYGVELEEDDGTSYYEIEIGNRGEAQDVYVHATTGEVLKVEDDDDDEEEREEQTPSDILSHQEAVEIAQNTVSGKVIEMELDEDDGRYVYEFELRTDKGEAEVEIDAETGEVLETELDD